MLKRFATPFALLAFLAVGGAASAQTGSATPNAPATPQGQEPATSVSDPSGTAGTVAPPVPQPGGAGVTGAPGSGAASTTAAGQAPGGATAPRQ